MIAWNLLKITLLNTLMTLCARKLWPLAKDIVLLFHDRYDLTGKQKFALALEMIADKAKELGIELSNDAGNFLIEAAVQAMKAHSVEKP